MPINIEIPDDFFDQLEMEQLKELLTEHEISKGIEKIVFASLEEYKEMLLGMGLPSRADEIRQRRLYLLIKNYFDDKLPTEAKISAMFQLTQKQSKSLLQNTITKFHFDLQDQIKNSLLETILSAEEKSDTDDYRVNIQSDNILERLNRIISIKAPELDPIQKVRGMARYYSISIDSYNLLVEQLKD